MLKIGVHIYMCPSSGQESLPMPVLRLGVSLVLMELIFGDVGLESLA